MICHRRIEDKLHLVWVLKGYKDRIDIILDGRDLQKEGTIYMYIYIYIYIYYYL